MFWMFDGPCCSQNKGLDESVACICIKLKLDCKGLNFRSIVIDSNKYTLKRRKDKYFEKYLSPSAVTTCSALGFPAAPDICTWGITGGATCVLTL